MGLYFTRQHDQNRRHWRKLVGTATCSKWHDDDDDDDSDDDDVLELTLNAIQVLVAGDDDAAR